jgi:hypothetical protein
VRPDDPLERVDVCFLVDVLDDRFDDEVHGFSASNVVVPDRLAMVASRPPHLPLGDAVVEELLDAAETFLQKRVVDLANDRLVARRRRHLRDARPHQPASQHANRLDLHVSSTRGATMA